MRTATNVSTRAKSFGTNATMAADKTWGGILRPGRQTAFVKSVITNEDFLDFDLKDQKNILRAIVKAQLS